MFVSQNQFYVFAACVMIGGICGIFFSLSSAIKFIFKSKLLGLIFDCVAFILTTLIYINVSYSLHFPSFRIYMPVGVVCGLILYFKSLHLALAKMVKKPYNIIRKKLAKLLHALRLSIQAKRQKRATQKVKRQNDRVKVQKNSHGSNGRRSSASRNTPFGNDLSVNIHRG